jgi:hypothetical protein
MPKNTVIDPINDKEMAFAHLLLSGTMTDREAAQAAGLNPETASYTKARPRIRDYMIDHRDAVEKRLVDQEAEGLRNLNLGRDQILTRLWELASLSPDATRGSITGQIKAMAMIVAIEGLIPDPRRPQAQNQPTARSTESLIDPAISRVNQQQKAEATEPAADVITAKAEPKSAPGPEASPRLAPKLATNALSQDQSSPLNPFIDPGKPNWVPGPVGSCLDLALDATRALSQPFSIKKGVLATRR